MTCFRKLGGSKVPYIPGTKPSVRSSQLITSTGVAAIDVILGGGLPVGSLMIVEEDYSNMYAPYLIKYFVAEGVANGHCTFLSCKNSDEFLQELPAVCELDEDTPSSSRRPDENMKIAWRYENLSKVDSSLDGKIGGPVGLSHNFDLASNISVDLLVKSSNRTHDVSQLSADKNLEWILSDLKSSLHSDQHSHTGDGKKNLARVAFQGIGSPLYGCSEKQLPGLVYRIKCLLRNSYAVGLLTVPAHILNELTAWRIRRHGDAVFSLESFEGSEKEANPAFAEYHGLFHIIQLPRLHSINCNIPDCLDLAFKLKRKKFSIEKLHLPPDLSEITTKSQQHVGGGGCASATHLQKKNLDF